MKGRVMRSLIGTLSKIKARQLRAALTERITDCRQAVFEQVTKAHAWSTIYRDRPSTAIVTLLALLSSATAQAATDGATIWGQLTGMWFGAPGLIIGAVVLTVGIIGFFRNGFGWTSVVFGVAAGFFLVPGITMGLQKYAAGIATP